MGAGYQDDEGDIYSKDAVLLNRPRRIRKTQTLPTRPRSGFPGTARTPRLASTSLRITTEECYGFSGFRSQALCTRSRFNAAGENSAIRGPRGERNSILKIFAPIN